MAKTDAGFFFFFFGGGGSTHPSAPSVDMVFGHGVWLVPGYSCLGIEGGVA